MAPLRALGRASLFTALVLVGACTAKLGETDGTTGGGRNGGGGHNGPGGGGVVEKPAAFSPVVMRRLNRAEYNNTVRDLLQTELRPADAFPVDDLGGGFPTVGSSLSLSPAYVINYEAAAHALIDDLFSSETRRAQHVPCAIDAEGEACAGPVLREFARKAWRRPVTDDEVTSLLHPLRVAEAEGFTPADGLRHAMAAVLLSPYFIFKVEVSPGRLDGFELATRLSYSLWGTMPDDALLEAAAAGALLEDDGLAAQVERMLADDRAGAFLDNFAARWLDYHDVENHEVNAEVFAEFTPELGAAMKQEANRFIYDALQSDAPVSEMLTTPYTFVNELLAAHYGITDQPPAGLAPGEFWQVDASSANRGGLLTLGALLTHTSLTSRTSPVKRGDFVLKHLLCGEIPPPPPEVEGLPDSGAAANETLRERMERHSSDPACSGCHKVMDPIGFGLENFDGIGRFRTQDGAKPVDASGTLPEDMNFEGAQELAAILSTDERFPFCVTKHFMTYSIGRVLKGNDDEQWAQYLTQQAVAEGGSLRSIIEKVVLSEAFRHRAAQ